ncbi:Inosine/uridine-preferring nucleoside hydrolase domain-containing protein [Pavlovales sp. CCMP2436]|nr:Inosine/uridine-preferring nucleoside hydrolase domain-containing protein [Pavlovales sp. CCMP2436]
MVHQAAVIALSAIVLLLLVALLLAWRRYRTLRTAIEAERRAPMPHCASVVVISDPGEDLDDEMAMIMARFLEDEGLINLLAVVTNLQPAHARARLMRGTLDQLRLQHVPVGSGTDGGAPATTDSFSETAKSYMPPPESERAQQIEPGRALLHRVLSEAEPRSVTLLCISSLKDAALFLRDNGELCATKLKRVVVMGGVTQESYEAAAEKSRGRHTNASKHGSKHNASKRSSKHSGGTGDSDSSDEDDGELLPDTAHNNAFDAKAAAFLYAAVQHATIPLTVVSRFAAYAAPVRREIYDHLAQSGAPIGWRLRKLIDL